MHARVRGNLPAEVNSFIGRRLEVSEARRLLSTVRLVTLIGPGGVGKTGLARQVAAMTRVYGDSERYQTSPMTWESRAESDVDIGICSVIVGHDLGTRRLWWRTSGHVS